MNWLLLIAGCAIIGGGINSEKLWSRFIIVFFGLLLVLISNYK